MRESEEDDEVKAEGMERRGVEAMEGRARFRVSMFGHNRSQSCSMKERGREKAAPVFFVWSV